MLKFFNMGEENMDRGRVIRLNVVATRAGRAHTMDLTERHQTSPNVAEDPSPHVAERHRTSPSVAGRH